MERRVEGSGCCAQVYRGRLREGKEVAVKVLHPQLAASIELDLALMRSVAACLTRLLPDLKWLNMEAAVTEFQTLLESQLDLRTEADNLQRFRENFKAVPGICFPEPVMRLSSQCVLVEDWVEGHCIQDWTPALPPVSVPGTERTSATPSPRWSPGTGPGWASCSWTGLTTSARTGRLSYTR